MIALAAIGLAAGVAFRGGGNNVVSTGGSSSTTGGSSRSQLGGTTEGQADSGNTTSSPSPGQNKRGKRGNATGTASGPIVGTTERAESQPGALALGSITVETQSGGGGCPTGFSCQRMSVSCPDVEEAADGVIATAPATAEERGMVVIFTGGSGTTWFSAESAMVPPFIDDLRSRGLTVVQVQWEDAWLASAPGEAAGPARLACRPATAISWIHEHKYAPLKLHPAALRCGFCLAGNSGGASQISYAVSHYGLSALVDAIVPSSGPPHASLAKGCLARPGEESWWFDAPASTRRIDISYGTRNGDGPCSRHDQAFEQRFLQDAVDTGGNDYTYPSTRVHIILSASNDTGESVQHAKDFAARLRQAGSPSVTVQEIQNMGHEVSESAEGLAAVKAALLGG